MQKKLASILFSTRLTAVLFIVFAIAMGIGTFLDASSETSPTPYSREIIYNAWWFEAIMVLFAINFCGNIVRYRLYKKDKWSTLVFHLAFILVIVGAAITRYIGYEGVMQIREGETNNILLTEKPYLKLFVDGDYKENGVAMRRNLAPIFLNLSERLDNDFSITDDYKGQYFTVSIKDFIKGAKMGMIEDSTGEGYLKIVEAGDGTRHDHLVKVGTVENIHNILFAVNNPTEGAINITITEDGDYTIASPFEGSFMRMADRFQGTVAKDSVQPFQLRSLYQMADMAFVIPEPVMMGRQGLVKVPAGEEAPQDGLILEVSSNGETNTLELLGGKGTAPSPKSVKVGGLEVFASYASQEIELPFSITLNDFIAEKYPGTEKGYASFKSKVTVTDADGTLKDEEIFMNNVLDKGGYRFFQSGFDPDEKGTILSVNHDRLGTWVTYIGYFLMYLGLMVILFDKGSRFGQLEKMLKKIKNKKAKMTTLLLLFLSMNVVDVVAQNHSPEDHARTSKTTVDSIIQANIVSKEHAAKFANLVIQDNGRMKPVNTFASELLRQISESNTYEGLDANQVFLSMTEFPRLWVEVPLIKLKRGNDSIRKVIGVPEDTKRIALLDLFETKEAVYKLEPYLEKATSTNKPTQIQKDFIKTHESFYLLNQALSGSILKFFPIPEDDNNKWISMLELSDNKLEDRDSLFVKSYLPAYFATLKQARKTGDYTQSEEVLGLLTKYQKDNGGAVMPSENKVKAEVLYNKVDIFNRLYRYFLLIGAIMFIAIIVQIFKDTKGMQRFINVCKYIMWGFFGLMTLGLVLRWYISGHAPWSDAYESIIYIAWATVFFGLAFGRKSDLTIASTGFVAAIILWVAHLSWLTPAISTLQPVLDSYWLMIHVSVIVASYGPFTLGMILGITVLILMLLTNKANFKKMELNIKELTIINEMALTVGLVMLTIGNFLGGQWANESWGRYWGWDPKETWALISIMIYAFVIHVRLIPGLRGRWLFNVLSIFAYASIMMTYFGVNFYLTGLHSYASGDVPTTPTFVYFVLALVAVITIVSWFPYKKWYVKKK